MSAENVELVRAVYELGDFLNPTPEQLDRAFRDHLDIEFELRLPGDYPEGEPVFRGREGIAEAGAMFRATFSRWQFDPHEFLEAGDRVVVFAHVHGEGEASGVPIEFETTHVWTVRGGRALSVHAFRDRAQALKEAGLPG